MLKNNKDERRKWLPLIGLPFQIGATIFLGNQLGVWLGQYCQKPYLEQLFTLLFVAIAMYLAIRQVIQISKT